jgi:SAM-dependent methyltransferase
MDKGVVADPRTLEGADCPMCGSADSTQAYRLGRFGVVRCTACRLYYLSPRLPESAMLELYRSGDYFEGGPAGYDSYADQTQALRATFRRVVAHMVRLGLDGGSLLEVGCGYGFLLDEARTFFSSCTGTEFSDEAAAVARERGFEVFTGGIEALPSDRRFDCIIATHVVEHVYDPRGFVAGLKQLLRPGGTIVLATPDMGSLWRRSMGSRWPSFKVPEHVLYFDRRSLTRLLVDAGFEQIQSVPYPHSFPLALVLTKLRLGGLGQRAGRLGSLPIRLPATTLALSARLPVRSS